MTKKIFVSGMFRSGTTLLAKLLNSHENITMSSDAFFPVFKFIRNKYFNIKKYHSPFSDYVYHKKDLSKFKKFQKINLNKIKFNENFYDLKKKIFYEINKFSPELKNIVFLKNKPKKYSDIFIDIFRNLKNINNNKIIGIKEVWVTEFIPIFNKLDKNFKHIIIIRDPRAIISSNFVSKETYPIVFLIKQWKKIVNLAVLYKKKFPRKVLIIKYEDLIVNPKKELTKISKFINTNLKNLDKKIERLNWSQNSSYGLNKKKFNKISIYRWKQTLKKNEKKFIEKYCYSEMAYFNYKCEYIDKLNYHKKLKIPKKRPKPAKWLKNYIFDYRMNKNFLKIEDKKIKFLRQKIRFPIDIYYDKNLFYLHKKIFNSIYK